MIIIEYASKWWVTWPFLYYHFENDQFGQFIRNYIRTSGSMIRWLQKQYFCNVCNKCLNLRYRLVRLFPILLLHIMTVRDWKMFLPISRDLSTDKHQKVIERLPDSIERDKSPKMKNSNQNSPNGPSRKILTLCQFPDLLIEFSGNRCIEHLYFDLEKPEKRSKLFNFYPVRSGPLRKFFRHPQWCRNWWRHVHELC